MDEAAAKAVETYNKMSNKPGDRAARHATRAVLLRMDFMSRAPQKKQDAAVLDVALALRDQSTAESSLCAALLLEQAALAFRETRTPMQRKCVRALYL